MKKNRISQNDKDSISSLQGELDGLRRGLNIGDRGEVLFRAELGLTYDTLVVEADGFGGAVLRVVEGNYPIDYFIQREQRFATEEEADREAERLLDEPEE
jgi:hypothetical protein